MSERIKKIFEKKGKKLVTFTTGGDPDFNTSLEILKTIINNGIDIIEIGMPFSDPMADGPTIQESSVRSLSNGTKINDIFEIVMNIRKFNNEIPIILVGYYNSIFNLGIDNFTAKCAETGVDGLIIVDLQPEEDSELFTKTKENGIDLIRLITPTTDQKRLTTILSNASLPEAPLKTFALPELIRIAETRPNFIIDLFQIIGSPGVFDLVKAPKISPGFSNLIKTRSSLLFFFNPPST